MQPAIVGINYYRASTNVDDGSGVLGTLFKGQDSGFNQLGVEGILPGDRGGQLTAMMLVHAEALVSGASNMLNYHRDYFNYIRFLEVTLFINNNEHVHGPFGAFPHPPAWSQGGPTSDTTSNNNMSVQNSGYMLANLAHDIEPRMNVKVTFETPTSTAIDFDLANGHDLECWLQTADARPISAS